MFTRMTGPSALSPPARPTVCAETVQGKHIMEMSGMLPLDHFKPKVRARLLRFKLQIKGQS